MRAIVTGASQGGIGGTIARRLAQDALAKGEPAKLAICATAIHPRLTSEADALRKLGAEVLTLGGDLADENVPGRLIENAVAFCGGLDAIVANAGVYKVGALTDLSLADWELAHHINIRSVWLMAKAGYPALRESRGAMVVIGSSASQFAIPAGGPYATTKAGVTMLAQQLSLEWAAEGVRVNVVSPGPIRTPMNPMLADPEFTANREAVIPLHRMGEPEDIAGAVSFLLGRDAAFITGENLLVDGGLAKSSLTRLPPGRLYKV